MEQHYKKQNNNSIKEMPNREKDDSISNNTIILGKHVSLIKNNETNILRTDSFREYIEHIKEFVDLQSMFICMILNFKEKIKGCENCETCSQIIELVDINIRAYKKISKLAYGFANIFMYLVNNNIPNKLNDKTIHLLNVVFILLIKNLHFPDIQFIYDKFKAFININAFEGLALRIAIQKYNSDDILIMLKEWGCSATICNHHAIIGAFYYEKFSVIRSLIELGSSYKYYLQIELSTNEYQKFQKIINKYLAKQLPNATEIEKELHIVDIINDFRIILIEKDIDIAKEYNEKEDECYNPIATDYFLEYFMQYFYETTGIMPNENHKKKKKRKSKINIYKKIHTY